jgi:hypothetical protein
MTSLLQTTAKGKTGSNENAAVTVQAASPPNKRKKLHKEKKK